MAEIVELFDYMVGALVLLTIVVFIVYFGGSLLDPVHSATGTSASLPEQMFGPAIMGSLVIGVILVARKFWSEQNQTIGRNI